MKPTFTVQGRVRRPLAEVFEAVADPSELSGYFTTGGARGRIETGATVTWDFADFPGAFPVKVGEVVRNHSIRLEWDGEGKPITVEMTFTPIDAGTTLVAISEYGWPEGEPFRARSYGNCGGWMQMLCSLKAWKENGINLRDGMFDPADRPAAAN